MNSLRTKMLLAISAISLGAAMMAHAQFILTGCADISQSGVYTLDRDIRGTVGSSCLRIHDATDVQLDCHGHSIATDGTSLAALVVETVSNFTVRACNLPQVSGTSLFVGNSSHGTIAANLLKDLIVNEPDSAAAATLRLVGNEFSEFGHADTPDTHSFSQTDGEVIPLAEGVNYILANQMAVPNYTDNPVHPGPVELSIPMATPRVYPNPWRLETHFQSPITFDHLAPGSTVKLFTVSAHAVRTLYASNTSVTWDLRNDDSDLVASGVYLYVITNDQTQRSVGQLVIIR